MADPVLHIKDSYYFELPKVLYPYEYRSRRQFPDVWISLDPEFQAWEAQRLYDALQGRNAELPARDKLLEDWQHWVHANHANFAKPLKVFLEERYQAEVEKFNRWKAGEVKAATQKRDGSDDVARKLDFAAYLNHAEAAHQVNVDYLPFLRWRHKSEQDFERAVSESRDIQSWKDDTHVAEWGKEKIAAYNKHLSGKVIIPQPFGSLRNLYERESGFAISKYMLLEVAIGLIILLVFAGLAKRLAQGGPPRGYLWNLLETFLLFIRDDVVRPSVGSHHEEGEAHGEPAGERHAGSAAEHGVLQHAAHSPEGHAGHAHGAAAPSHSHGHHHEHEHQDDAARLLPLFWTIFFFVLGCNLFGMLPWLGAPSSSFSVTTGLALVTLVVGIYCGIMKFGFWGHLSNQIPAMDLPIYMAVFVKPLVYAIEVLGLMIKHGVLAIRLLANMVAGHLVILGIMGVAFGATGALLHANAPPWQWPLAATVAVLASTAFGLLELFVAFLQAYIFTFLSALFIGATLHKH